MFEGYADTPGVRLWCWDTGGNGEAVVLCHPASQGTAIWENQRDAFAAAGYRVVAYARRGYARSETGTADDPGSLVGDLANLLDCRGVDRAHVLGAAAGGITATGFAVAHPERTRSLILAGTIVSPDEDEWRTFYDRLGIADLRGKVPTEFLELGPAYRATEQDGTQRFEGLSAAAMPVVPVKQPLGATVTWQTLERLTTPVLLVTGEADLYAPPPLQDMIAAHLTDRRLETIPAVGHAAYWETPDRFNAIVLDFLNSVSKRRKPQSATS